MTRGSSVRVHAHDQRGGDWRVGPMGVKTWDAERGCFRYEMTPEGRRLFESLMADGMNPIGFVRRDWPGLYRLSVRLLGKDAVVASGWVALWRAVVCHRPPYTALTWARQLTRDELQRQTEEVLRFTPVTYGDMDEMAHPASPEPSAEAAYGRSEAARVVRDRVAALPPIYRDALTALLEEKTLTQLGRETGRTRQAWHVRYKSGLERLRRDPVLREYFGKA